MKKFILSHHNNFTHINTHICKIFLVLVLILCSSKSYAHGVGFRQTSFKSIALEFFYSTGEKMSYREAKVFSPKDEKFAVQTGRTDEEGRFAFIPDCVGEWRVIVRDEEGHQCNAEINITQEFLSNTEKNSSVHEQNIPRGFELFIRALLGVSIIFNIAMLIYRRKSNA